MDTCLTHWITIRLALKSLNTKQKREVMDTCLTLNYHMFNTFTVPACKMSRLEDAVSKSVNWRFTPRQVKVAWTCLRKYIRQSFNTSALNATCSGENPFTCKRKKENQKKGAGTHKQRKVWHHYPSVGQFGESALGFRWFLELHDGRAAVGRHQNPRHGAVFTEHLAQLLFLGWHRQVFGDNHGLASFSIRLGLHVRHPSW